MAKVQLTKAQRAKRRRRIIRQTRGAFFVLLALIGIGTIVSMTVRGIRSALSGDDEKETYTALVAPLVAEDPVPFESIDKANISMLTESAIWATHDAEDTSKYSVDTEGHIQIPSTDIARYFKKMYGSTVEMIKRKSFSLLNLTYEYDISTDTFALPAESFTGAYAARVTDIQTTGGTKVLTVAYLKAGTKVDFSTELDPESVVKYMDYILMQDGDWYIYSVQYHKTAEA